jgi:secondary thiamine-phosphate synthase enzyme
MRFMASLRVHTEPITVRTAGKGTYEITDQISEVLTRSGVVAGTLTIFVQHTSCSLIIMEHADPTARRDLEEFFDRLVPENAPYFEHNDEGPDDMPSHIRMLLSDYQPKKAFDWLFSQNAHDHAPQVRGASMLE